MKPPSPALPTKVNFERVSILVLDGSAHGLEILCQVLTGFGFKSLHRANTVQEAQKHIAAKTIDLIVADPDVPGEDGYNFLKTLRRSGADPNRYAPIVLVTGHTQTSNVKRSRDIGANMIIAKPVSPKILLDRIVWITRDPRPFVEVGDGIYIGPDRRFKFAGPPPGVAGRRQDDLDADVGDADEPNMSQSEIDAMLKPQKVVL